MRTPCRWLTFSLVSLALTVVTASPAVAQVELDRIVSKVNGRIITQSDVNQARLLKLVPDTSSDDATRIGLENRLLILGEVARASGLAPSTDQDLNDRRTEWRGSVGDSGDLLVRAGMTEAGLDAWLKDDVRIRAYLRRQFSNVPEADRGRATDEWLSRLRQRAGLK